MFLRVNTRKFNKLNVNFYWSGLRWFIFEMNGYLYFDGRVFLLKLQNYLLQIILIMEKFALSGYSLNVYLIKSL